MLNIDQLSQKAAQLSLSERMHLIAKSVENDIVFTTSFGIEDQAITHAIHTCGTKNIKLATLDTGRLFPQTYTVWAETEAKYGIKITSFNPNGTATEGFIAQNGINGFYNSIEARKACCTIRKVVPLARALAGAKAWVTGLRGGQSDARLKVQFAEFDTSRNLVKFNPLFDWTRQMVVDFTTTNNVSINTLHAIGFVSIGCAPCTRAISEGEPERAGRWWWEDEAAKECGLHVNSEGKLVPMMKTQSHAEVFE